MASARLEEARGGALEGEGRQAMVPEVADLLGSAEKALANGGYENMDAALLRAARLHARQSSRARRRAVAELVNAAAMLTRSGASFDDLSEKARDLLDRRMTDLSEERNLREATGEVRALVRRAVEERMASAGQRAEQGGGDKGAVRSLLASARKALSEDRLEAALDQTLEAERMVGATGAEVREHGDLTRRYLEQAAVAQSIGAEASGLDHYRQALSSGSISASLAHLREAVAAIEASNAPYLPDLTLRATGVVNQGQAPALAVTVTDLKGKGAEVAAVLWPQASAGLPASVPARDRMTVLYRALFMARPMVKELIREGSA
jgi:hypothetical protein